MSFEVDAGTACIHYDMLSSSTDPQPFLCATHPPGGTGLDFSSDGAVVRDAISSLKARQPNTRVLLAVGGATYTNFAGEPGACYRVHDHSLREWCRAAAGCPRCCHTATQLQQNFTCPCAPA